MAPPIPQPKPGRRKYRRPEAPQFARHPDTGERTRVWEFTACGEPLPYPQNVSHEQPPCQNTELIEDDESPIPHHPAEV